MSGAGTVVFQIFLVLGVCAIAITVACDIKKERDEEQMRRGGLVAWLAEQGLIRKG